MKRWWPRAAPWVLAPACLVTVGEWALRRSGYEYVRIVDRVLRVHPDDEAQSGPSGIHRFDPYPLWSPRPGAMLPWTNGERINADGYRGPQLDVERKDGVLRIAFLGGAATMGVGVRWEDSFPALSTRLVGERIMPAECLNAGVQDFSVRQCLERYRALVRPYRPHVVVMSVGLPVCYRQARGGWTDDQLIQRARHLGTEQPSDAWPDSRVLQLVHWMKDALVGRYWKERDFEFQQQRLAAGYGDLDWPGVRRVPVHDYHASLAWLVQELRQDGAHLVLLSIPGAPDAPIPPVHDVYLRTLADFADREKILLLDARHAYMAALRGDVPKEDLFQPDENPSECGHAHIAQALADALVQGIAERSQPKAGAGTPTPR